MREDATARSCPIIYENITIATNNSALSGSLSERRTIMTHARAGIAAALTTATVVFCSLVVGQDQPKVGFTDTPMLPGDKWHVHDGNRPDAARHHARHVSAARTKLALPRRMPSSFSTGPI